MPKVRLDLDKCISCGKCVAIDPDNFDYDMENLKTLIKGGTRTGELWEKEAELTENLSESKSFCPTEAIEIGE